MLEDLEKVMVFVLSHDRSLLYGNLGRSLVEFAKHLADQHPTLDVIVVSRFYTLPNIDNRIRSLSWLEAVQSTCDLLVYSEPDRDAILGVKPMHAERFLVLSSHHVLEHREGHPYAQAVYVHGGPLCDLAVRTKRLQALQEAPDQALEVNLAANRVDFQPVVTVGPYGDSDVTIERGKPSPALQETSYVIVNLVRVVDPVATTLYFWDAFDHLIRNLRQVKAWSVCFGPKRAREFEDFVQESVNRLFCGDRDGDDLRALLSITPFYRSGIVDRRFVPSVETFCRFPYYAPEDPEKAFLTCARHDLTRVVGNVYRFR